MIAPPPASCGGGALSICGLFLRQTTFAKILSMEDKQKPINTAPMAMAELEIMKAEGAKSVADKNPEIKNIALLLAVVLGVTLFSQIISYLIITSFNNTQTDFFSLFINSNGVLGITLLLIQVIAVSILLFTRNSSHAKTILLVAGIGVGASLINGIFSLQFGPSIIANAATLVVNFFILRKIFNVYLEL
jgi:hypothetical protein